MGNSMRYLALLLLVTACSDETPTLAQVYDYSYHLNQPAGVNCTGNGVLDFQADTLGITSECFGSNGQGTGAGHGVAPVTNLVQDGSRVTFDLEDCAHQGTVSGDEINGTLACEGQSGALDVSGDWTAVKR
jgi:hypothetical protein